MATFTEDLAPFFDDFAVPATWTPTNGPGAGVAQPGKVIIDSPETQILGEMIVSRDTSFIYPADQWPALDEGDVVIVNAKLAAFNFIAPFSLRLRTTPQAFDDGSLLRAEVAKGS